ncbi:MAG: hypothetical protein KJ947_10385 [Alphaproteobacteria bacterium]|nr:hypothetical protein [Alphaproteobacteria bacterium]MBU1549966.1 hypothetical protein [Alphaproteobacteria bacterium]MBU2336578.1 hypothetical protein [Alphaproteobacteria bacterium]MBU2387311.1 hypothetical protein [Alphaproteobacteria bacterium]
MTQISLAWGHYPDTETFIVIPSGITQPQLQYYAHQCGFLDFQNEDGLPLLCGSSRDQKDALRCTVEAAGYELAEERIFSAIPFDLYAPAGDPA